MVAEAVKLRLATVEDAAELTMVFLAARRAAMPYLLVLYTNAEVLHWIGTVVLPRSQVLVATLETADGRLHRHPGLSP